MTEQTPQKYTVPYIQIQAYDTTQLPDKDCPLPERVLWWTLRDTYARFKAGQISREAGEQLKQKAMQCYAKDKANYDMLTSIVQHQADMWARIENAARDYAKSDSRTPEADAFYEAVYGCKLKDAPLAKENEQ